MLTTDGLSNQTYNFTENGIAWGGIAKNYAAVPDYASPSDVLPPPGWRARYPDGYENFPNLREDEHFQVWMRVAALPTFRKLWARNDNEVMPSGRYRIVANMSEYFCLPSFAETHPDYPVAQFSGTKSIVISTVSWIGGKQPFLGWAYIAAAILCVILAIGGLIRHLIKPRKLGDMSRESLTHVAADQSFVVESAVSKLRNRVFMHLSTTWTRSTRGRSLRLAWRATIRVALLAGRQATI